MKKHLLILSTGVFFFLPLYGYAEEAPSLTVSSTTESSVATTSTTTLPLVKSFTLCSQEAIETRDSSIAQSRLVYNTAMANTLTERKNKEKAAVALKDENKKKNAIKLSAESYKHQAKVAQTILIEARKIAWENFDNDVKECRGIEEAKQALSEVPTTLSQDEKPEMKGKGNNLTEVKIEEPKSFKETFKNQLESFKSLFN